MDHHQPAATSCGAHLRFGALASLAYAIIYVACHPLVVDEALVAAQLLTGQVSYPAGHPIGAFFHGAYNFFSSLAALQYWVWPSGDALSVGRNVLFLFLSTYVPFAMATVLTGSALAGAMATAITLADGATRFAGHYPTYVFPSYYSHGHVGLMAGLLTIALLLGPLRRTAALLLGLLPSIHPPIAAVVLGWSALYLAAEHRRGPSPIRRMAPWFIVGASCTAAMGIAFALTPGVTPAAPYDGTGQHALEIYRNFVQLADYHRRPIPWLSHAYLLNPLLFALAITALAITRSSPADLSTARRGPWLGLFALMATSVVWLGGLLDSAGVFSVTVQMLMPSRFSNLTSGLLVPVIVGAIFKVAHPLDRPKRAIFGYLCASALALAALHLALQDHIVPIISRLCREVADNDRILLFWTGLAFGVLWHASAGFRARVLTTGLCLGVLATPQLYDAQTATTAMLIGCLVSGLGLYAPTVLLAIAPRWRGLNPVLAGAERAAPHFRTATWLATMALVAATVGYTSLWNRRAQVKDQGELLGQWTQRLPHEETLKRWFDAHPHERPMVVTPLCCPRPELQAKLGRPSLIDMGALYSLTYNVGFAHRVADMVRDIYDLDLKDRRAITKRNGGRWDFQNWTETWPQRSTARWRALSNTYQFSLVLAPQEIELQLEKVLDMPLFNLYRVPTGGQPDPVGAQDPTWPDAAMPPAPEGAEPPRP